MRKYRLSEIVVCALLLTVIGCKEKIVTLVTAQGSTIQAAQNGQILEWRLLPSSVNVKYFDVTFIGADPCGSNHPPLRGYPNKPVSCTATTNSQTGEFIFYQYNLDVTVPGGPKGDFPDRVVPCVACGLMVGSHSGSGPVSNGGVSTPPAAPATKSEDKSSISSAIKVNQNPVIVLDCVAGAITVRPSDWEESTVQWYGGANIQPDWTVTFDGSVPCSAGQSQPFTSSNNTCTISSPGTYKYTVTAAKCSSTLGAGTVSLQ